MLKKVFFILILVFAVNSVFSQWNYSIDDKKNDRKDRISGFAKMKMKVRSWFKDNKQQKADKKKKKLADKEEKKQRKLMEQYQVKQGKDKEITGGLKVSKRMKRMKKESNRINHDKPREGFFQRLFAKNKHNPVKFKKN